MTKISLRVYNHEIEAMIENGQVDEAIAHCKNILMTFPMHLETYRLLGKAFLETRRYSDAADIFQRVLMSVPEDFVSHVGMSIIRDDEKKLDDAIWHMERAFEVQPSNPAIQDELRKLYGRRDGVQPPKVRLTRDALANMYTQGALYSQAIAEIRAVLADDPNRPDLQVMLARAYSRDGRKKQAIEICTELLKKFPYCFDALRILIDLMPPTDQHEFTQTYRLRVKALDPYSEFVTGSIFTSDTVPDAAVDLELLDYDPNDPESGSQAGWATSLGIRLEPGDEQQNVPESFSEKTNVIQPFSEQEIQPSVMDVDAKENFDKSDVPDWMRSSGWEEPSDQTVENAVTDETNLENDEPLAKADIPEWLKDMAPDEELLETDNIPDGFESMLDENFLKSPLDDNLIVTKHEPVLNEGNIENDISEKEIPYLKDDTPDGKSIQTEETTSGLPGDEISSWLGDAKQEVESGGNELKSSGDNIDDLPDWLKDMGPETVDDSNITINTSVDIPDQPGELFANKDQDIPNLAARTDEGLPDWLNEIDSTQEELAKDEELKSTLGAGSEILPKEEVENNIPNSEFINQPGELVDDQEKQTQVNDGATLKSESVNDEKPSAHDQDEALTWLESLAARQGVESAGQLTKPEDRLEETPEQEKNSIEDEAGPLDEEISSSKTTEPGLVDISKPDENKSKLEDDIDVTELSEFSGVDEHSQVFETNEQGELVEEKVIPSIGLDNYPDASVADETKAISDITPSILDGQPSDGMDGNTIVEGNGFGQPDDHSHNHLPDSENISSPEPDISEWLKGLDADDAVIQEKTIASEISEFPGSERTEPLPDRLKEMEREVPSSEWISASEEFSEPIIGSVESDLITDEKNIEEKEEIFSTEASNWINEDADPELDLEPLDEVVKPVDTGDWQPAQTEEKITAAGISEISNSESTHPNYEADQISKPLGTRTLSKIPNSDIEKEAGNLEKAQSFVESGDIKKAIEVYGHLIKKGQLLEGVVHDLRETTMRYPAEIGIWQLLGDAYMRVNRLQDALDAYTKAEELLR